MVISLGHKFRKHLKKYWKSSARRCIKERRVLTAPINKILLTG
jgi:hypothetical protein